MQIDPMIEEGSQEMLSPYQFGFENPVRYSDPDGKFPILPALPIIGAVLEGLGVTATNVLGSAAIGAISGKIIKAVKQHIDNGGSLVMEHMGPSFSMTKAENNSQSSKSFENTNSDSNKKGDYSHLKEPKKVGPGLETTRAQRQRILEENKRQNGGELVSDESGKKLNPPQKAEKGKPADPNQAEVDHKVPKSKNGSNSNANLRVISKEENQKKYNN